MGAEIGATCSLFPYDDNMAAYLKATGREAIADAAPRSHPTCGPTPRSRPTPSVLRPGHRDRPRRARARSSTARTRPTSTVRSPRSARGRAEDDVPVEIVLRAHRLVHELVATRTSPGPRSIARQAAAKGLRVKTPLLITPGSEQVRATIERDGLLADLEAIGGDRAGQRLRAVHRPVGPRRHRPGRSATPSCNSYNRNFPKRNDGNADTMSFVTLARDGHRAGADRHARRRPAHDSLTNDERRGRAARPAGRRDPAGPGFDPGECGFLAPPADAGDGRGRRRPGLRPPAAARAVPRVGRSGLRRTCRC